MTTTLSTLRSLVLTKVGLTSSDGRLTSAALNTHINVALQKMATDYDWPWLVTRTTFDTVASQEAYSAPARWTRTKFLAIENDVLGVRQPGDLIIWSGQENVPHLYAIDGDSIYLCPVPNDVYTVKHSYVRAENALSGDSDTPLCPDWYIDVVVVYAAIEAAKAIKDITQLNTLEKELKDWKARLRDNVQRSTVAPSISVREDW